MAGSIEEKLSSSDVVRSLRMEDDVANIFSGHDFAPERSIYYDDPETKKQREIDVYFIHVFDKPKLYEGIGAPFINLSVVCECKSLVGFNIIFLEIDTTNQDRKSVIDQWIGDPEYIDDIIKTIKIAAGSSSKANDREFYKYITDRAYPSNGTSFKKNIIMPPPSVDLVSTSFRETRNGQENLDSNRSGPVWNAIRSSISAIKATKERAHDVSMDWISGMKADYLGKKGFVRNVAFFLDSEMMRFHVFHPVVTLDARLWALSGDSLKEISSVRLYVNGLQGDNFYVDIVSYKFFAKYAKDLANHYKSQSYSSIEGLWNKIEVLKWEPGQEEKKIAKLLYG